MTVKFGSARIDENGNISGGKAGDQTGKEVSQQAGYMHSKGWYCYRAKSATHAKDIAQAMIDACNNGYIGYDQKQRGTALAQYKSAGSIKAIKTKCETDCSALVRLCIYQATGKLLSDFNTSSEPSVLSKSGLFDKVSITAVSQCYTGDILVTKSKGHTVIVTSGKARETAADSSTGASAKSTYTGTFPTLPTRGYFKIGDGYKTLTGETKNIKYIQKFCNWAVDSGLSVDGDYGEKTAMAVKTFQGKAGITKDGEYGKDTLAKAKKYSK